VVQDKVLPVVQEPVALLVLLLPQGLPLFCITVAPVLLVTQVVLPFHQQTWRIPLREQAAQVALLVLTIKLVPVQKARTAQRQRVVPVALQEELLELSAAQAIWAAQAAVVRVVKHLALVQPVALAVYMAVVAVEQAAAHQVPALLVVRAATVT
jgi:hypothetical protein